MVKVSGIEHAGFAAIELIERGTRLIIVHEVGPRVAWFGAVGGDNLLFWDDRGAHVRGAWRLYGGHRLWTTRPDADESEETYAPDNEPCRLRELRDGVAFTAPADRSRIEKTLTVRARGSGWLIEHRLRNVGDMLWSGGAWALTSTLPGKATRYRIPLGAPRAAWDVFTMVVPRRWGGTHTSRIADPQFQLGNDEIMIRPRGVEAKRMMYVSNGTLRMCDPVRGDLIKRSAIVPGASYPRGTNVAVYIGPASFMVELETMSPIVQLSPRMSLRPSSTGRLRLRAADDSTGPVVCADALRGPLRVSKPCVFDGYDTCSCKMRMAKPSETILCLSHLRWNFVYQRPQHLLSRCAREHRVIFIEEPMFDATGTELELRAEGSVEVAVLHLPAETPPEIAEQAQHRMLDRLVYELDNARPVLWYLTPMAIAFTHHVKPRAVVYDCMDELSLFQGAPAVLKDREALLLKYADVVFTGGHSLYEYKKAHSQHANIHPFPSSVDTAHFGRARRPLAEPADQAAIPHPRVGFFGVIDERMDLALLSELADQRPDLQLVMIGPVVKISPDTLPQRPNLHWLGSKTYHELPAYLASWDVAMLPFARNDATRFISPTKTPEYLAAGKPVVSTSITDVVRPYGREGLAWIADSAGDFATAIDEALRSDRTARVAHADAFLDGLSWDDTWNQMWAHVQRAIETRATVRSPGQVANVPGPGASAGPGGTSGQLMQSRRSREG